MPTPDRMAELTALNWPDGRPKIAPVQGYAPGIPWSLHLKAYAVYCKKWGTQEALIDLAGRGCRGGFSDGELDDFVPGWRDEVSEIGRLRAEVVRLETLVYVPGVWRCAKCDFRLIQSNLNANTGTVTARDTPGDKCPNCQSPLWRVTERQERTEALDMVEKQFERTKHAEWVGYYFGLQRAFNKGLHTRVSEELETEMGDVLLKMPPGTVEAWPAVCLQNETDS